MSLEIYVAHTIFLAASRILLQKILKINDPSLHLLLGTAVGIYAPIALTLFCRRFGFKYMFTFPG